MTSYDEKDAESQEFFFGQGTPINFKCEEVIDDSFSRVFPSFGQVVDEILQHREHSFSCFLRDFYFSVFSNEDCV